MGFKAKEYTTRSKPAWMTHFSSWENFELERMLWLRAHGVSLKVIGMMFKSNAGLTAEAVEKRMTRFHERYQRLVRTVDIYLDHPLLGGPDVPVECDGTTPMTYQKSGKGHPAVFKGCIVISATDRKYLRLALRSKASRGSESYENLRCVPDWLDDDSILWFDDLTGAISLAESHPDKFRFMGQVNHSNGQFVREAMINGKRYLVSTQNCDGVHSHLKDHFKKWRVQKAHLFRHMTEFQLVWNCSNQEQSLWHLLQIGASRPYASKDDLKGPELCPSHEIKHMSVLREAKLRLKEELDLSTIQRPFDLKYVPILHSTSISEEDRGKGLIQHRRREKRNALKPYYCFCCKSYPFGQVVSSEEDQIAHYDKDCEAARIFEEKVKEKMNEIRESEDFLKVIERKRKIQESIENMNSFNNKKAKEKSNIVCNIFHLPEFPKK